MDAGEKVVRPFARMFSVGQNDGAVDVLLALAVGVTAIAVGLAIRMAYELGRLEAAPPEVVFVQSPKVDEEDGA